MPLSANSNNSKPRIGFLGIGWIGLLRLEPVIRKELAIIEGVYDSDPEKIIKFNEQFPSIPVFTTYNGFFKNEYDGIVISTPSALHYQQTLDALTSNFSVFCQKPLALKFNEYEEIIKTALANDKLLRVDYSYRYLKGIKKMKEAIDNNEFGKIFHARFVFHNSYGPDKDWYYNRQLSGGGCLIDLGVHLIDLAINFFGKNIGILERELFHKGEAIYRIQTTKIVEDYAYVLLKTMTGIPIELACSWGNNGGEDATIGVEINGTDSSYCFHNINGSFYDFVTEKRIKTKSEIIEGLQPDWGSLAIENWLKELSLGKGFNIDDYDYLEGARIIDGIYS